MRIPLSVRLVFFILVLFFLYGYDVNFIPTLVLCYSSWITRTFSKNKVKKKNFFYPFLDGWESIKVDANRINLNCHGDGFFFLWQASLFLILLPFTLFTMNVQKKSGGEWLSFFYFLWLSTKKCWWNYYNNSHADNSYEWVVFTKSHRIDRRDVRAKMSHGVSVHLFFFYIRIF